MRIERFARIYSLLFSILLSSCSHLTRTPASFSPSKPETCAQLFKSIVKTSSENSYLEQIANLSTLSKKEKAQLDEILSAMYFIDYTDRSQTLLDAAKSKNIHALLNSELQSSYDFAWETEKKSAFRNYRKAREFIRKSNTPFKLETLKSLHGKMMDGGIEELAPAFRGQIRNYENLGTIAKSWAISKTEVDTINLNPYLEFEIKREYNGLFTGSILYPTPSTLKKEALNRIKKSHPEIYSEIQRLQETLKLGQAPPSGREYETLTRKVISALTEERVNSFEMAFKKIGPISSTSKLKSLVELTASYHRDLISIHPFGDGNGRTMRMFMLEEPFHRHGIQPPMILDVDEDLLSPMSDWVQSLSAGLISANRLIDEFSERSALGLPLNQAPELLTPLIPREFELSLKTQGSKKIVQNIGTAGIDPRQFQTYVLTKLEERQIRNEFKKKPQKILKTLYDEFLEFKKQYRVQYAHKKNGTEDLGIYLVDQDYKFMFGKVTAKTPEIWKFKMESWHHPELIWRGLADFESHISDNKVLEIFQNVSQNMVSNQILFNTNPTPSALLKAALNDFDRYNESILADTLHKYALDHSRSGKLYDTSFGYSTSKDRKVGKAFAMGAMVVADYGKHHDVELQKQIKSRVLIGAYQAKKDVDLTRLKQLDHRFSNIYGRQQEVMGIGAADPDSIMVVQLIDENGQTIKSFVRDVNSPDTIYIVKGEFNPDSGIPTPDDLIATHKIK